MKKIISIFIILIFAFVVTTFLMSYPNGITGRTTTGCTCHGTLSPGNSVINISANPDIFSEGFTQGDTYTLTLTVTGGPVSTKGGFNLKASGGQLSNPGLNAKIDGSEGTHSAPDARSWTIDWIAPATDTDSVVFHFAGNAVNGDGGLSGDDPTVPVRKSAYKQSTSVDDRDEFIVESFQLYQNYPNPFNSETRIGYRINTSGTVEFIIFDLLGRKIYGASRNRASAGSLSFVWTGMEMDGTLVASGVYTYQI